MSPSCQRLAFTVKGTDLSSTGGYTYCTGVWVFAMRIYVSTIVPYFRIICYWNVWAYVLWKGQLDIWPFEERCQLIYYQEPFWILFICSVCIPVVLIQSNFDTPGDTSRSDTNWFSRDVQPIFRDICFSCSRAITIHQVIAIFLQFHCLSSYRNDSFPLQLIDQITFLLSRQMCHVN